MVHVTRNGVTIAVNSKQQLRTQMRRRRDAIAPSSITRDSAAACRRMLAIDLVHQAKTVFVYVSFRSELQTERLIRQLLDDGKTVAVPKMLSPGEMIAVQIGHWNELQSGPIGFLEPAGAVPCDVPIDVCIAPGLAFTERGDRLGYGQGNYDQFLETRSALPAIGLAFDSQIVDFVPVDVHDRPMDFVVTERRVIDCRQNG